MMEVLRVFSNQKFYSGMSNLLQHKLQFQKYHQRFDQVM